MATGANELEVLSQSYVAEHDFHPNVLLEAMSTIEFICTYAALMGQLFIRVWLMTSN